MAGTGRAFAPMVWAQLPELVRQPALDWWRDPTVGQRLLADAAAIAGADAMFVLVARELIRSAQAAGLTGDRAIDGLAGGGDARDGVALLACLSEVARYAVIAGVPDPFVLRGALGGEELETAEDAVSDLCTAYLQAGADALAVIGSERSQVADGVSRAAMVAGLFGRPVLGVVLSDGGAAGWVHGGGAPLAVVSDEGVVSGDGGVVITDGDVSGRWDAERLAGTGAALR